MNLRYLIIFTLFAATGCGRDEAENGAGPSTEPAPQKGWVRAGASEISAAITATDPNQGWCASGPGAFETYSSFYLAGGSRHFFTVVGKRVNGQLQAWQTVSGKWEVLPDGTLSCENMGGAVFKFEVYRDAASPAHVRTVSIPQGDILEYTPCAY